MLENELPKLSVVGSIPIARSNKIKHLRHPAWYSPCRRLRQAFPLRFKDFQRLPADPRNMTATNRPLSARKMAPKGRSGTTTKKSQVKWLFARKSTGIDYALSGHAPTRRGTIFS